MPLRRPAAALLLLAATALPAAAQPGPAGPADRCAAILPLLPTRPVETPVAAEPDGEDGCRYRALRFPIAASAAYEVETLLIRGLRPGVAPTALRIEARGIGVGFRTGTALDWVTAQQRAPFDLLLDVTHDPATGTLTLRDLALEGDLHGRMSLGGVAEGVRLPTDVTRDVPGPDALERAAIRSLRVRLDGRRLVQNFILNGLTSYLPDGDTGAAVEAAKAEAERRARDLLPRGGATPATVDAVARFIRDFPQPRHPFTLDAAVAEGTPPIGLPDLIAAAMPDGLTALAARVRVTATYEGAFRAIPPP